MNLSTYTKETLTILSRPNHSRMNFDLYERELDTHFRYRIIPKRVRMYTKESLTHTFETESPTFVWLTPNFWIGDPPPVEI